MDHFYETNNHSVIKVIIMPNLLTPKPETSNEIILSFHCHQKTEIIKIVIYTLCP